MRNKFLYYCCVLCFTVLIMYDVKAQEDMDALYERIKQQMEKEFVDFKNKNEEEFNKFVEENDKAFTNLLNITFKEIPLDKPIEKEIQPKPLQPPKIEAFEAEANKPDELIVKTQEQTSTQEKPFKPIIQKTETQEFPVISGSVKFFGTYIDYSFDKNFITSVNEPVNNSIISEYWTSMCSTNHYYFINQMLDYRQKLNLNDWGYLTMVRKVANKICNDNHVPADLLTWFVMNKSQYKVKIGYDIDKMYIMVATPNTLYGRPYFTFSNTRYYLLDANVGKIKTYQQDYPDAKLMVNFEFDRPLNVGQNVVDKDVRFFFDGTEHIFKLKFNNDDIAFYQDYPLVDLKVYFDAYASPVLKESLLKALYPLVKDKNEYDAVNLLLSFVQFSFKYKTDNEQFGKEKFFFPDEMLYFPFSDCEDRSVFFAYLVKELVGLEVVGLQYPGHMATAVHFNNDIESDFFTYNDKKFTVCDPTYEGATVGICMPQYVQVQGTVIELANRQYKESVEKKTLEVVAESGVYKGGTEKAIVTDDFGNSYITGFFNGNAYIGGTTLKAPNENSEFFVAKYDRTNRLLWVRQSMGEGNDMGVYVATDKEGNCFVSGTYDKPVTIGQTRLESNGLMDIFIAKYGKDGNFLWANKLDIEAAKAKNDHIYVSMFGANGTHQTTLAFEETENFNNYGITIDRDGNVFVTASFPTSSADLAFAGDIKVESAAKFSHGEIWKAEYEKLVANNYDKGVAGIFAFLRTMKANGATVAGSTIQDAITSTNTNFKKASPKAYENIGKLNLVKNAGGVITITTEGQKFVDFGNLRITNDTKIRVTTYQGGNAQINFINGASVGEAIIRFDLNYIKLYKDTGNLIFDYDADHSQKKVDLRKDILE